MIKGILLDIDGTLVLSNEAHAQAWVEAFQKYGYDISFNQVKPLIGMGSDKLVPTLIPDLNLNSDKGKELTEYRKKIFQEKFISTLQPTPGARDLIKHLKELDKDLIVATSADSAEVEQLLMKAEVNDLLDQYTTSSDVNNSKPAPDIILSAIEKLRVKPEEAVMIGDTKYDIEAAHRSSVKVIVFRCGGSTEIDLQDADEIYNDPADLVKHIEDSLICK